MPTPQHVFTEESVEREWRKRSEQRADSYLTQGELRPPFERHLSQ
jgi:hypothetical protein